MKLVVLFGCLVAAARNAHDHVGSGTILDPIQPLLLPDGAAAKNPLAHLGGNGPWTIGPDVQNISSDVPENCHVDQAAYILRHGSRYPDQGAYNGWVEMARRFKNSNYTANGPLSFVHQWSPPLTDPDVQIAQLSQAGVKEASDLGYTLRTRYRHLYNEGDSFYVWANNYTRVIQTAQAFVRGFIGVNATLLGNVVSVTSKGFITHLGDTLAPSDMCPTFKDDSSAQQNAWSSIWLPPFIQRLSKFIHGNLTLDESSWGDFPYLCGFESQITGRLSPFCDTFTQDELEQYEYLQDLRYYYGLGPATNVSSKMMVPFLHSLMARLAAGPDARGTTTGGGFFNVPNLLMSFLNDGQLVQLASATGIFDNEKPLPVDRIAGDRLWRSSRITPMRGTIAFERLNCKAGGPATSSPGQNKTFVRIRLNEAVYQLPFCHDGPGKSCSLSKYVKYVADKLEANGSFAKLCNVTDPSAPTQALGASFFGNLGESHLQIVKP
ncbi:hypothetical protein J3458_017983 [Metarhizium acridum]|uniref:uncharacterized protein n=1 Tax=Metarhizium acridum TaxID=92637 RepID=UPI001C6C8EFC|nr:hypothetical protein J3458_017983 [Metarhizium acridum]